MSNPFLGEIRMFAGNFAPTGWAQCNGQLLPLSQNTALFSLLGTMFGGDGRSTFALPNLQGCAPMYFGQGAGLSFRDEGETGGEQSVTLLQTEMPSHAHSVSGTESAGTQNDPAGAVWGVSGVQRGGVPLYAAGGGGSQTTMSPLAFGISGGSLPHNNMPPYLVVLFIIALQGIFPSRP